MKIAIIGYSGSGKSTLAQALGREHQLPILHLDTLRFAKNWQIRPDEQVREELQGFLEQHTGWVIDGNYSFALFEERMEQADQIIFMNFPRWICLWRAVKRYLTYKGQVRDSMAAGCTEKFDWEFIRWILWDGRSQAYQNKYQDICSRYPDKVTVLSSQKEIDVFLEIVQLVK